MVTDPRNGTRLVLLPSPLLGPAVWAPVAAALVGHGRTVSLPPALGEVTGPEEVLERWLSWLPTEDPLVLVPHSNAGLYGAALAAARDVRGVVYVDAALPGAPPSTPVAPVELRELLGRLADDTGRLPPWTQWWPADELLGLFPDEKSRAAVEAEQPRLPLAYFEAAVPTPAVAEALPAAYLAFGGTYAQELAEASSRGWPVERLAGGHLHPLVDPAGVAGALEGLLGRLGL